MKERVYVSARERGSVHVSVREKESVHLHGKERVKSLLFFEGTFIHIYAALNTQCKHTVHTCLMCLNATTLHLHPAVKSAFGGCVVWLTPPSKNTMYVPACCV